MPQDRQEKIKKETKPNDKKMQCDVCGATLRHSNIKRHERSKKHKDSYDIQCIQFDMT